MIIRIEFGFSKSHSYPWAVRLAKLFPTYEGRIERGVILHAVEFDSRNRETWGQFMRLIGHWQNVTFFLDGDIVSAMEISNMPYIYKENGDKKYRIKDYSYDPSDPLIMDADIVQHYAIPLRRKLT